MRLEMIENESTFFVLGAINKNTVLYFKNKLEYWLEKHKTLVLNLDKVTEIDIFGMEALDYLILKAAHLNKKILLLGLSYETSEY